jgi:hypothetical protein
MSQDWFVCDMDRGVLHREGSRRAAVWWWIRHTGSNKVIRRHKYMKGYYSYTVGAKPNDCHETAIVREDKLPDYGLDISPGRIEELYPRVEDKDGPL